MWNTQFVQLKQKKGLQWVYWEGSARGFENRSKWKNAAMKWHYWFHVFTPDRLQTVGPLKENRRIGWEPNIGPLILVCSSFPHICSPPRQQNCHQGGKSLKSLKRLFNWRIFILSLTRRLWEWSAPVAPFISPWSPIEPTNIGQPPNCNEISLWGHFYRECYSLLHCVSVKRRWGPILFENSSDFPCSLCSVLKLRINFSTIDNFSIVELSLQQRNQKINVKWVKNIFHWIYVSSN